MGNQAKEIKVCSFIEIDGRLTEVKDLNNEQREYVGTVIKINMNRNRLDSLGLIELTSEKLRPFDEIFKEPEKNI